MKAKLKLDKESIQDFFLHHSEKIALGVVVLLFGLFVYAAAARPTYEKTPERLKSAAADAQRHIEQTTKARKPLTYADWPALAHLSRKMISEKPYEFAAAWNPPLFPERRKRVEPKLYPVDKLVAHADVGQFSIKEVAAKAPAGPGAAAAAASSGARGQRWVVLTGVVPWADQVAAYRDAFRDNPRPESDTPAYPGYRVERAEAAPGSDPANLDWQPVNVREMWSARDRWGTSQSEVAPAAAVHEILTFALGPLNGVWDHRVVHLPEIPLASSIVDENVPAESTEAPAPVADFAPLAQPKPKAKPGTPEKPEKVPPKPAPKKPIQETEEARYLLFRFFDFSVEPGKQYRYRVQLVLTNPNFGAELATLADEKLSKEKYVYTKWSEPTDMVQVPPDTRVFIQSLAGTSTTRFEEVGLNLTLLKWLHDGGNFTAQHFKDRGKVFRGQLLSFVLPIQAAQAGGGSSDEAISLAGDGGAAPKGKSKGPTTDYSANLVLVDFRGSLPGPGGRDVPKAEVPQALFLDDQGRFVMQNEAEDKAVYERIVSPKSSDHGVGAAGGTAPSDPGPGAGGLLGSDDGGKKPARKPATKNTVR